MLKSISNIFSDFKKNVSYSRNKFPNATKKLDSDVFDFLKLVNHWPKIIGENLAQHSIPLKNSNGKLTILTDHSAFSQQLNFMEKIIKNKIFQYFPELRSSINKIYFKTNIGHFNAKKSVPSEKKRDKKKVIPQLHPFSPQYIKIKQKAELEFKEIKDEELKKTLTSIYIQMHNS